MKCPLLLPIFQLAIVSSLITTNFLCRSENRRECCHLKVFTVDGNLHSSQAFYLNYCANKGANYAIQIIMNFYLSDMLITQPSVLNNDLIYKPD